MGSSSRPTGTRRANAAISAAGGLIGAFALALAPFVSFRPNRIVEGETYSAIEAFGAWGWVAVALWLAASFLVFASRPGGRRWVANLLGMGRGLIAAAALVLLLVQTGTHASDFAAGQGPAARTSFSWGFYVFLLALYLVLHATAADTPAWWGRLAIWAAPFVGVVILAAAGTLGQLGIVREWTLTRNTFGRELVRHLFYALGATIGAVIIGVPLGILAARRKRAEAVIMGVLNLGQVLPVLAFVGIMIPILGGLSDRFTPLKALGISGIGWAPVMVVLLVYALFPVTRNTLVAIRQLDPAVIDTARGMGMGRRRALREVEFPLALPVVLVGVRIALVQSTAGAIIAAFVGGGGLGTIMFMGLEQTSMDLVLVGVLPIAALALVFDTMLRAVGRATAGGRAPEAAVTAA